MHDTWFSRDLPVLDVAVRLLDKYDDIDDRAIERETGFDEVTVQHALKALVGIYLVPFDGQPGSGRIQFLRGVTPAARRAVGAWPTPDSLVDQLLVALRERAGEEDVPATEEQSRAREILKAISAGGRDVLVSVASAVLTGAVT